MLCRAAVVKRLPIYLSSGDYIFKSFRIIEIVEVEYFEKENAFCFSDARGMAGLHNSLLVINRLS